MKVLLFFLALIFFIGCSKVNTITEPDTTQTGSLSLKIDPNNIPANVVKVCAELTRTNYPSILHSMNLLNDSTANLQINSIATGEWHLKIDAKNQNDDVLYTGETDVTVQENITTNVNLTLMPVSGKTGSIYIYVTWGNNNGNTWLDYLHNPILSKSNSAYEKYGVMQPRIYYDGCTFRMWYIGLNDNGLGYICYAVSNDGINWTKPVSTPVISPGTNPDDWDRGSVGEGPVIYENGQFKMYYNGWSDQYGNWSIGLAYSQDGIHWEKYPNPILSGTSGWEYQIGAGAVIKKDNTYYLYYTGRLFENGSYYYKIGLATSTDGVHFTRSNANPILSPTYAWEGTGVFSASIIVDDGKFKMAYMSGASNNAFGKATSIDGINWTKEPKPFFDKTKTSNGWGRAEIAYPWLLKVGNEYRVYYSGYSEYLNLGIGFIRCNVF